MSSCSRAPIRPPSSPGWSARRQIARIDVAELRCTEDEALALLGGPPLDRETVARASSGRATAGRRRWCCCASICRGRTRRWRSRSARGKDAIFQYFAGEIFTRARPENQRALMITAILPSITEAEARRADRQRRGVAAARVPLSPAPVRRPAPRPRETTWHYHALFREFLLEEGRRRLPRPSGASWRASGRELLEARGEADEALALYRDAGDCEAMRRLVSAHALDWARHGRAQALSDSIEALPAAMREPTRGSRTGTGRAWIFVEPRARPRRARARLRGVQGRGRPARPGAGAQHDRHRLLLRVGEFRAARPLAARVRDACYGECVGAARSPRASCGARSAYVIALLFRRPDDPASRAARAAWTRSSTASPTSTRA